MKKYLIIASALLLAACAKEAEIQDEATQPETSSELVTYTFKASINATKAFIDDSNDDPENPALEFPLVWEKNDAIALISDESESAVVFTIINDSDIEDDGQTATFTAAAAPNMVFNTAYYPSDYRGDVVEDYYATKYNGISLANSKKCFAMEAAVYAGDNTIHFTQKGSLVRFKVSNLPSFARKAKLVIDEEGDNALTETVAITSAEAGTGSAEVYFAIPAIEDKTMTFSLEDSNTPANTFFSKMRPAANYGYINYGTDLEPNWQDDPTFYRFKVAVGPVVSVVKQTGKDYTPTKIHTWTKGDSDTDITTWSSRPSMFVLNSTTLYYVYDNTYRNQQVGIQITNDSGNYQKTNRVYLDRDITLTAGNTTDQLVGTYRIYAYPRNGMGSSDVLKVFAKAWPNNTETNVSDAWPGTAMTASSALGSGYYYWDFNEDYASWSNIGFEFYVSDSKRTGTYLVKDYNNTTRYVAQDLVFYFNLEGDDQWYLDYKD